MKILFVATEMDPFFKLGGLGDVIGTLPEALSDTGLDVSVVIPLYKDIDREYHHLKKTSVALKVPFNGQVQDVEIWEAQLNNVQIYFIENQKLITDYDKVAFAGNQNEVDHYAFFSRCVVEWLLDSRIVDRFEVVHLHDWHTGLVPRVFKLLSHEEHRPKFVFTIHNLGYHGFSETDLVERLGIENIHSIQDDPFFLYDAGEDNELDLLLQGLLSADFITTVSQNYANEIQTPEYCQGLCTVLKVRSKRLKGILNGLDYELWDSSHDNAISKNFPSHIDNDIDLEKVVAAKKNIKESLQNELNLLQNSDVMMLGSVGRLDPGQKGLDILDNVLRRIFNDPQNQTKLQFVLVGEGSPEWEEKIKKLEVEYPGVISVYIGFDDSLARKIYAASDLILIPSKYEPCGLVQMISMAYGAVPLVRATGGLKDTVFDQDNGFVFSNYSEDEFYQKIIQAKEMYFSSIDDWQKIVTKVVNTKFTWNASAKEYKKIYEGLV